MFSTLRVAFDDPSDGWVGLKLMNAGEEIEIIASYTPHKSFLDLVNALYSVFLYEGEWRVVWNEEPMESEFLFRRNGSVVYLELLRFPDHRRVLQAISSFKLQGSYEEVALPFWRALRNLQGRFSCAELNIRWHRDFPWKEIEELTSMLKPAF